MRLAQNTRASGATRVEYTLFAYPAEENAAESEPEQERIWNENRLNAQNKFSACQMQAG